MAGALSLNGSLAFDDVIPAVAEHSCGVCASRARRHRGLVWLASQVLISYLGRYHSPLGSPVLPEWIDLLVVAAFSTVIYYLAVASTLSTSMVATLVDAEHRRRCGIGVECRGITNSALRPESEI